MKNEEFDARDFRRALGKFPTGVTIITAMDDKGEPIGVTASRFNTLSMQPPLILWSVDKKAFSAPIFQNAEYFAVNVLGKSQVDMSNRFAGRGEDKFGGVDYQQSKYGNAPLFTGCAAQFECKTWNVYEGGDHYIIVGEVIEYSHYDETSPLVFSGGSYAVPMQHPSSVSNKEMKLPGDGFLGDYLLYLLRLSYTNCSARLYPELLKTYDITPEEWRVLTLLGDAGNADSEFLAKMVGQPIDVFMETFARMQDKGFVKQSASGQIELTEAGEIMANNLFELARSQESLVLSGLSSEEQTNLKRGLKQIANASM